jgi:hypothetical protein
MAGSKMDHESGIVNNTTPAAGSQVGDCLYVIGSNGEFGYSFRTGSPRLVPPPQNGNASNLKGKTPGQTFYNVLYADSKKSDGLVTHVDRGTFKLNPKRKPAA